MKKNIISHIVTYFTIINSIIFASCKENIDTSDLYTFTGETVADFIKNDSSLSQYNALLEKISQSTLSPSSMASLLSARGNYTCFAPTNEAISNYLNTLYKEAKIESNDFVSFIDSVKSNSHVYDSIAKEIVYNSIIDNGKNDSL